MDIFMTLKTGPWALLRDNVPDRHVSPLFLWPDRNPDPWTPAVPELIRHENEHGRAAVHIDCSADHRHHERLIRDFPELDFSSMTVPTDEPDDVKVLLGHLASHCGDESESDRSRAPLVIVDDLSGLINRVREHRDTQDTVWMQIAQHAASRPSPTIAVFHGDDHHLCWEVKNSKGEVTHTYVDRGIDGGDSDDGVWLTLRATGQMPAGRLATVL